MPLPRRSAFTLLEVILVLAVIAILVALTYPSISTMYAQHRVTAGSDALRAALASARSQAMEDGVPYRVAVLPGKGNYRVAPDVASQWSGGGTDTPSTDDRPPLIFEDHLPRGVIFAESTAPQTPEEDELTYKESGEVNVTDYRLFAVYLPDGTARDDQKALVCGRNASPMWVSLRCVTGVVSVTPYKEGDK
jgi:prepilin-type N-terminal cleavage/methylation domain-containing protein